MVRTVDVSPRKKPRQERSRQMDALILEAATRVLAEEGAARFNTNRVAERAGVSVGSLYQYYPNKAALLFRLHELETAETRALIARLLGDVSRTPRRRVFDAVRAFFETEAAEIGLRQGLAQAQIYFRESEAFVEIERSIVDEVGRFLRTAQPARGGRRDFDARFVTTVIASVAESVTNDGVRGRELRRWADRCSAMVCDHVGL